MILHVDSNYIHNLINVYFSVQPANLSFYRYEHSSFNDNH